MGLFKKHNTNSASDALLKEVSGLDNLRNVLKKSNNPYLKIPQIISSSETLLEMTAIDQQQASQTQMQHLGKGLALLHQVQQPTYGLNEDNYIGLNPQPNCLMDNWGEFFIKYRLLYQVNLIRDVTVKENFLTLLAGYQEPLLQFLNRHCEHPSLVHGDLWSGNVLFDDTTVWLIDPAIYFGDREVDLAMTEMFGGFSPAFYQAYDHTFPRSKRYAQKKVIYNLYHYLNHYNLFGNNYLVACQQGFDALENCYSFS